MQARALTKAIESCADPQRAGAYIEQLEKTSAGRYLKKTPVEQARILTAILGGSQTSSELLLAHPDWLGPLLEPGFLEHPRLMEGLRGEVDKWLIPFLKTGEYEVAFAKLREFKQREMLRVAARDLVRLGDTLDVTRELSNIADVCLETVYQLCHKRLTARLGQPFHLDENERWQETKFCVFGLGKLGGQELNYSSDIDILFIYSEEGNLFKTRPRRNEHAGKGMTNHAFFVRLGEMIIAEIGKMTAEGSLFRIDLRLRPEGKAGPLARSLASYENFYSQWGQTWERMMLIKARPVAGDAQLGAEFLEMIQPFRYPRSLNERILREVAAMKQRIELEVVKAGELDRNVKLGRGGIREIEFVAQSLQLLRAGRLPFLQGAQTIPALQKLVEYSVLSAADGAQLEETYFFLRDVEHRLQMEAHRQTHTIPTERRAREWLARLMGFDSLAAFEAARQKHSHEVRRIYDQILAGSEPVVVQSLPGDMESNAEEWKKLLAKHSFRDAERAFQMLQIFVNGPGYVHISPRTMELARELLPVFFALCPRTDSTAKRTKVLSDPDRVLVRLDSFIDAYGARAMLYDMWTQNRSLFELLLLLFDRSEFLAERAVSTPDLVDELESSGRLRQQKSSRETLRDLQYGIEDKDQRLWLRRYHQAELMRIGLRDILCLVDFEQNLIELSSLAEACLQYTLEVVLHKNKFKTLPLCVIGLGKLGGSEIGYGSDLDIVFVTDSGAKGLPPLQRIAVEVMDLLSAQTELGLVFRIDARLRPDGEKGLLVNTLEAYEEYYRRRASLWEIQSLTRIRPVAGDFDLGAKFQQLAGALANFTRENVAAGFHLPSRPGGPIGLEAYNPKWKEEIAHMRERIARERTPAGKDHLAIKTGTGGLIDAEFLAQMFCLTHGWQEPNTMKALRRACESGALEPADGQSLLSNYGQLRRIEGVLRRWSFEGETLLPDEDAPLYRVAVRCGFANAAEFMKELGKMREAIRRVYTKVISIT